MSLPKSYALFDVCSIIVFMDIFESEHKIFKKGSKTLTHAVNWALAFLLVLCNLKFYIVKFKIDF